MDNTFSIHPIGYVKTDFDAKFGIPRQSGLVPELEGEIVFLPEFRRPEAFRELEYFSHIWVIWQFSAAEGEDFRPTVRPPRLGGNRRVGVFASRSPFHPNRLGLSCVKLLKVDLDAPNGPVLKVSGIDMLNGTPVFDVKPYVPVADCIADAHEGYTAETRNHALKVSFEKGLRELIPQEKLPALIGVLENDPRPGYDDDPLKEYGLAFADFDVGFRVEGGKLSVFRVTQKT
ncbi:MAG: tRNA (N6-threonylcarbamoyladenosine(37)-N6)-methyltransferase TrmO [Clostridia bacterium]|nr:tRNA (N6-threonylcarbamoyladenosine(37)-N6)-methyltransferase TrmO [Clostridia bacterium]